MATSPAALRMQQSAVRQLSHFGGVISFQKYSGVKDWDAGEETLSATGSPIEAAADEKMETVNTASPGESGGKVRTEVAVWHVELLAFERAGEELSRAFRPTIGGVERRIKSVVMHIDRARYKMRLSSGAE